MGEPRFSREVNTARPRCYRHTNCIQGIIARYTLIFPGIGQLARDIFTQYPAPTLHHDSMRLSISSGFAGKSIAKLQSSLEGSFWYHTSSPTRVPVHRPAKNCIGCFSLGDQSELNRWVARDDTTNLDSLDVCDAHPTRHECL